MRRVVSLSVRPARGLALRTMASKASAAAASSSDPWANAPKDEAGLRDAILKAMVSTETT